MKTKEEVQAEVGRISALMRDEFDRVYAEERNTGRWNINDNAIAMWSMGEAARRVQKRDHRYPLAVYQNIGTCIGFGFYAPGERQETYELIAAV